MRSIRLTQLVIMIATVMLIWYDIQIAMMYGLEATLSRVMLEWGQWEPRVAFFTGVLVGHLLVPTCGIPAIDLYRDQLHLFMRTKSPELGVGIGFLLACIPWPPKLIMLAVIAGVCAGYFFWPQIVGYELLVKSKDC